MHVQRLVCILLSLSIMLPLLLIVFFLANYEENALTENGTNSIFVEPSVSST